MVAGCAGLLGVAAVAASKDGPDVRACEAHIVSKLAHSASYRRLSAIRTDHPPMSYEAFAKLVGLDPRPPVSAAPADSADRLARLDRIMDEGRARRGELGVRELTIAYEISGTSGQAMKATEHCAFRLIDGDLEDADHLMKRATEPSVADALAALAAAKGDRPVKRRGPTSSCCL